MKGYELIYSRFLSMAEKYPNNPAIVYLGETFTYERLLRLSKQFAGGLVANGLKKGDRVFLYLNNSPQWLIACLGTLLAGGAIVPVSPIYTSHEITFMLKDSGAEIAVCLDTNFCYVKEALKETPLKKVVVTNLVELLPFWKRAFGRLFDKVPVGEVEKGAEIIWFKDMLRSRPLEQSPSLDPYSDLAYILYTGGTTGFPKGVPGNHIGMTSYVEDVMEEVAGSHLKEGEDCFIAINPLFHIMAWGLTMALTLNKGNKVILMPVPVVDAILKSIEIYKVRWMLGVPALYRMILENDRIEQYNLSSLKYCYCGGDVLPMEIYRRWKAKFGVSIYQVYGSTEAGHVAYSRIGVEPKPGSIGVPLSSRECMLVDPDTLEAVGPGETGELLVSSPYTLKYYWNRPEETKRSYVEINGKIYYRMGDFVKKDPDGDFIYVERSADIIKHKGYRVSASEVETVLQDHPKVIAACVVGVPDQKVGERIKAIVVLKEDARGVSAADLLRWCRERLASYKIPSYIEFRDMLPKSKVGKLLRREIRQEEMLKLKKKA